MIIAGLYAELTLQKAVWITLAMIGARTTAMGFNRLVDVEMDAINPRTVKRALPAGRISSGATAGITLFFMMLFFLSAYMLNSLAFFLSPAALVVITGYSYTKRFTYLSHYFLGLALAIAPTGAWIGVTGRLHFIPVIISTGVMLWTAGFDILYSIQDYDFDRKEGLHSIPAKFGIGKSLIISRCVHLAAFIMFVILYFLMPQSYIFLAVLMLILLMLIYQHIAIDPKKPDTIERAFFRGNAVISVIFFLGVLCTVYL
jgi:4-hydroxybenzoate polyprenyltransferase